MTCINPRLTLLAQGLDSDDLYALPGAEDNIPTVSTIKSRKRPAAPKPRLVSFTRLWEYEDDGVAALPDQEPPPKRKKVAPKNITQASSVTLNQVWDRYEIEDNSQNILSASQLSTPPDSKKRAKSKVGSLPPKIKPNAKPLFEKSIITKATMTARKETKKNSAPEQVKSYQGFTTTEDKMKSATMSLSQTTLEKLAAFRYKPSQEVPTTATQPISVELHNIELPRITKNQKTTEFPVSSFDLPTSDSFFEQKTWPVESSFTYTDNQRLETAPIVDLVVIDTTVLSVNSAKFAKSANSRREIVEGVAAREIPTHFQEVDGSYAAAHSGLGHINSSGNATGQNAAVSERRAHFNAPTTSEDSLFGHLVDGLEKELDIEKPALCRTPEIEYQKNACEIETNELFSALKNDTNSPYYSSMQHERHIASTTDARLNQSIEGNGMANGSQRHPQHLNTSADVEFCHQTENEPSNSEVYGLISHPANTLFEFDFDDEIDEEDLRDLALDIVQPQTPSMAGQHTKNVSIESDNAAQSGFLVDGPLLSKTINILDQKNTTGTPSNQESVFQSFSVDEFDMEQDDVNQMLILSELCCDPIEAIPPHVNLQEESKEASSIDKRVFFSPPTPQEVAPAGDITQNYSASRTQSEPVDLTGDEEGEDWDFMYTNQTTQGKAQFRSNTSTERQVTAPQLTSVKKSLAQPSRRTGSGASSGQSTTTTIAPQLSSASAFTVLDDSHEYEPLPPFVRPPYTPPVMDRCPVVGLSAQLLLRTCFRIGDMFQVGAKCNALGIDAVIELFARVGFSSRESGTTKQHFQFLDLWHDRPPYPNGVLASFKTTGLAESESKVFLAGGEKKIARVLGKLKKDGKKGGSWKVEIINIRETDWEEIRWTRRIVSGDNLVKRETELCVQRP